MFGLLQAIQEQGIVVGFPMKKAWDLGLESRAAGEVSSEVKDVRSGETIKIGGCDTSLFPCADHSLWRGQLKTSHCPEGVALG